MMRSSRLGSSVATVCAGLALAWAPTAGAQTPVNTKYFFECADAVKVRNGSGATPWSTLAPAMSYLSGAGCGSFDSALAGESAGNDVYDAVFEGTHSGPVSSLTITLHDLLLSHSQSLTTGTLAFDLQLEIDGTSVLDTRQRAAPVDDEAVASSTGLTQSVDFTVTNLAVTDDGEHTYRLTIAARYIDTAFAWVWGASEIPAGIEFNPVTRRIPRIPADG